MQKYSVGIPFIFGFVVEKVCILLIAGFVVSYFTGYRISISNIHQNAVIILLFSCSL